MRADESPARFISSNASWKASCDRRRGASPSRSSVAICTVRWTHSLMNAGVAPSLIATSRSTSVAAQSYSPAYCSR